jgi:hypothetical protein
MGSGPVINLIKTYFDILQTRLLDFKTTSKTQKKGISNAHEQDNGVRSQNSVAHIIERGTCIGG